MAKGLQSDCPCLKFSADSGTQAAMAEASPPASRALGLMKPGRKSCSSQPCVRAGEWVRWSQRLQAVVSRQPGILPPQESVFNQLVFFPLFQSNPAKEQACKPVSAPAWLT